MQPQSISQIIAKFNATKNPFYLAKAMLLVMDQRRIPELTYGLYCDLFCQPAEVKLHPHQAPSVIQSNCQPLLSRKDHLSRAELIEIFGDSYAIYDLPTNFAGARIETIVYDQDFLIIGEYGYFEKRIAYITHKSCVIHDYYTPDPDVKHIHAMYKAPSSCDILVTTGDTAKYLDVWGLQNGAIAFERRLKRSLAGHTAITQIGDAYYLGTDFSSRLNYIERLNGKKFFFPKRASRMFVLAFQSYQDRYLVSL
jgi:hypothetical protein